MQNIKCPNCGKEFSLDEEEYSSILNQIRDQAFDKKIKEREKEISEKLKAQLALDNQNTNESLKEEIRNLKDALAKKDNENLNSLKDNERKYESLGKDKDLKIKELESLNARLSKEKDQEYALELSKKEQEWKDKLSNEQLKIKELENSIKLSESEHAAKVNAAIQEKEKTILNLENEIKLNKSESQLKLDSEKSKFEQILKDKETQIEYYKDLKAKMSTKLLGENLEQHCLIEFNKIRAAAFKDVYFEKDNDASSGTKGDFIYREMIPGSDTELLSIMFEMKNEDDTTATKHKNEDFFKKLDKDRKEKNCEYAILVSMLEADNEQYNAGISDVSYAYPKMYVVRPQCFIPIITILRNAAMQNAETKQELVEVKNKDIDLTHFEENMEKFKNDFNYNYNLASKRFEDAIKNIDDTISKLQKMRDNLVGCNDQLRRANVKLENMTIRKLTNNAPSVREALKEIKEKENE